MRFVKMHGLGNDFIIINSLAEKLPEDLAAFSQKVCDRHFGVGADGVIIVRPSDIADMRMQIINSDGSEAEMCGNGIRCFAKYLFERKIVPSRKMTRETLAGIIKPEVILDDKGNVTVVEVDMGEPVLAGPAIPTTFNKEKVVMEPVEINGREFLITAVSMGNPHCVVFSDDLSDDMLCNWGPLLEKSPYFPKKTNVEFVKVLNEHEAQLRVWERGAAVTLACGTGACATLTACLLNKKTNGELTLHLDGGDLYLHLGADGHAYMRGAAEEVFEGWIK